MSQYRYAGYSDLGIWITQLPRIRQISQYSGQNIQHLIFIPIPHITLCSSESLVPMNILIAIPDVLVL